jgi:hypothetical protein
MTPHNRWLPVIVLACCVWLTPRAIRAQEKSLSEKDIVSLVELQIDDAAIVTKLQKGGVSFAVDPAALTRLKEAGATDAVLEAVQAAASRKSAPGGAPVTYPDVLKLVQLGIDEAAILKRLEKSPTTFTLSAEQVAELKQAGASDALIAALKGERKVSPQAAELITDFAIVLDCSGSMKEATPEGETKMAAAKRVVTELVSNIPDGLNVTFVIYGHEVFGGANDPRNCEAVKVARPLSPLDPAGKRALAAQIDRLRPTGATPIALSLKTAGAELVKNDAFCGLILITDGLETCLGDPAAEAAALAENPKLSFGVNVIGFGTKPDEDKVLAGIAESGKGKYYDADSAKDLAEAMASVTRELETVAKKPDVVTSNRRAIKVLKPEIEFPDYAEIRVITRGLGSIAVVARGKYGDEIRLPSPTDKYEILWVPKSGEPVAMLKDFTLAERRVIEIKPEEHLGMIKVNGRGAPKDGILVYQRGLGSILRLQECKKYGEIMVVPAETVNVSVDGEDIEQGLEVEAGKLHELE